MAEATDRDLLVTIVTKLEHVSTTIARVDTAQADHEDRIRRLERWQWKTAGGASVVGGLIVSVVSAIVQHGIR